MVSWDSQRDGGRERGCREKRSRAKLINHPFQLPVRRVFQFQSPRYAFLTSEFSMRLFPGPEILTPPFSRMYAKSQILRALPASCSTNEIVRCSSSRSFTIALKIV